ncbi:LysR family transcriptional regulator [Pseudomonas violetae]|uniref:LysR family transcriptional regulator n=1 Tax=Pseudomonas violetae TaxID=2915813 RepID=A0ABT0ETP0_9PSED|nr:LysR family transcriptional regulator [Pseudomonas violetae]MCK1788831.1 LysR family transcriptional regulator [Pseudomonas violetae]
MNRRELRKVDLALLVCFESMMLDRNVTRVAKKFCVGQSTISSSLNRLRSIFNDPLFIRVGHAMEPTARAYELAKFLTPGLDAMSKALRLAEAFQPQTSDRVFRLGLTDDVEFSLLPRLIKQLRAEAPEVTLIIQHADYRRLPAQLISGDISIGVCQTRELPANAKRKTLRHFQYRVLCDQHDATALDLDEYCARPHVVVSQSANTVSYLDKFLAEQGRKRQVVLSVPRYSSLPAIIENSNLIATIPDFAAESITQVFALKHKPPPFMIPGGSLSLSWLSNNDNDAGEQWLRERVVSHMEEASAETAIKATPTLYLPLPAGRVNSHVQ